MLTFSRLGKHTCPECSQSRRNKRDRTGEFDMQERFWQQVEQRGPDECWLWLGSRTRLGYGRIMLSGQRRMAHRWALEFATGDSGEGRFSLHSCDNPRCVNPAHLRRGTQLENIEDRVARGRNGAAFGESNGSAKLTTPQVLAIRADSRTTRVLAAEYGVTPPAISAIKRRAIWSHVNGMEAEQGGKASVPAMQRQPKEQAGQVPKRHAR